MKIYVKFFDGDMTVYNVNETLTKDGYFTCLDDDGDKLFTAAEAWIKYVEYDYNYG